MCIECLVSVDSYSGDDVKPARIVRHDSHSADDGIPSRVLNAITKDEEMEFAPVGTYPSTGIDVLIVGIGFGGLTVAWEFTRKGHNVRFLERNSEPDISGRRTCPKIYSISAISHRMATEY
jgi:heterodisulfide reductase subunit A-like polyferredoxin